MTEVPPGDGDDGNGGGRLHRCIRDLAALNALPSMCVGRTPEETLDIVLDALPTALTTDLVYLAVPGTPPKVRASLGGVKIGAKELAELEAALRATAA